MARTLQLVRSLLINYNMRIKIILELNHSMKEQRLNKNLIKLSTSIYISLRQKSGYVTNSRPLVILHLFQALVQVPKPGLPLWAGSMSLISLISHFLSPLSPPDLATWVNSIFYECAFQWFLLILQFCLKYFQCTEILTLRLFLSSFD